MPLRRVAATALIAAFALLPGAADAQGLDSPVPLQLAVTLNGSPTNAIYGFTLIGGTRIGCKPADLGALGIQLSAPQSAEGIVMLNEIPTLKYKYDEPSQALNISIDPDHLKTQYFDLSGAQHPPSAQAGWGVLLNYDVFANTSSLWTLAPLDSASASLELNSRAFSPYGVLEQSGILGASANGGAQAIRLDTTLTYTDQPRMISYRAGDFISGGLAWTRPIRMGGLQAQSDFAVRPDLVTAPLPSLGGTAEVPSTVDIYVGNTKTFSQQVNAGPFTLNDVPVVSDKGDATVVITDSAGHQTRSTVPLYASLGLLAPDLSQWSLELGLPRLSYGSANDDYAQTLVGLASLRHGLADWATGELHAESGAGVVNGGVGATVAPGPWGAVSGALSLSNGPRGIGAQTYGELQAYLYGLNVSAGAQATFGNYDDLASATARLGSAPTAGAPRTTLIFTSALPPQRLYRATISAPLLFDAKASISASYLYAADGASDLSEILSGSYSRSLPFDGSLNVSVFHDFANLENTGFFLELSAPIGASTSISTSVSGGAGGRSVETDLLKPVGSNIGDLGWRVRDAEGASPYREAGATYRFPFGKAAADLSQSNGSFSGSLELRGSIAAMDGGVFSSDWIDDGFAVVDAGAPGVKVLYENRPVGVTDSRGMLLVSSLRSYEANKLAIDPTDLPVDVSVGTTQQIVAPADHAGVAVHFDVKTDRSFALVTFVGSDGSKMRVGAVGKTRAGDEFTVGYDGEAFIDGLQPDNKVSIDYLDATCEANFLFAPHPGQQVQIGPVVCK